MQKPVEQSSDFACTAFGQVVAERLADRGVDMPLHFRCVSDNATSDSKNNTFLKLLGILTARGRVNSAVFCQGRVGHTHNRQDASFSHVATVLSKAQTLQDPQAFKERIEFNLMDYHVELLQAAMDFQAWLFPVGTRITGFNQTKEATKQNLEACHSYKLVRRECLPEKWRSLVVTAPFLSHLEAHPRDVILFSKQYMASSQLSQKPMLYMPWELVSKLSPKPMPEPIPRHCFSERQAKEFLKTASLMESWKYKDSALYLQNLAPWL